jgi:hypothetical protein
MVFLRSLGGGSVLGLFRDAVDCMEERAKFCSSPELLLDAIDLYPTLYARFVRRHACRAEMINYPSVLLQLGDVVHRFLAILEELRSVRLGTENPFKEGGAYSRFPRFLSVIFSGLCLCDRVVLRELLSPVLTNQGVDVDLEVTSCFAGCVVRVFGAKA